MNATGKVVSATADGDVVIEENQNLGRQRWFIYHRNGKYHIVNKKYRKGVMSPTLDSNYITINREYNYCCWELEEIEYTVLPTSVTLSQTTATVNVGESFDLSATVSPNNTSQTVIWSSSDSNVATVSNQGLVTSTGGGTATITARSKLNNNIYATCTLNVIGPSVFSALVEEELLNFNHIKFTDDDFYIITKSLSYILNNAGISSLINLSNESILCCSGYYDDWYIFAVPSNSGYTYGLYKMREQESDSYDNNDPGVTISFIEFNTTLLMECILDF